MSKRGKPLDLQPNSNSISRPTAYIGVSGIAHDLPRLEIKPLVSFPAKPDPNHERREFYASLPSRWI